MLLLTFPELKKGQGAVSEALSSFGASEEAMKEWSALVQREIKPETDGDEFD